MRVALVHDWLNQRGGAENVLEVLVEMFPQAPIYTSMYWPQAMPPFYRQWDIRTSWLDRLPLIKAHHQPFLPFYPLAFQGFDLSDYDLVLSNKSGFCHGVRTSPSAVHICYCLTPTRYLWNFENYIAREGLGYIARLLVPPLLGPLRSWDLAAVQRVTAFAAISHEVQERISTFYHRDSTVIHPPVDTGRFQIADEQEDYFLIVSRLVPYKRIGLAVEACTKLGLPLVVLGEGRDRDRLEALAGPTVRFLGWASDVERARYMSRCRAFLFPGREDFGIAPVEAQAAGRPVIAYAAGGALDTIIEGETGTFFHQPTREALAEALLQFDEEDYDPKTIRRNAERFDTAVFKRKLKEFISCRIACPHLIGYR
ncbi:MAG: glycosyltransferase [Chloroflexota bacterium]|nr:glycosyltransferase [Chloroflexota bacterium]